MNYNTRVQNQLLFLTKNNQNTSLCFSEQAILMQSWSN